MAANETAALVVALSAQVSKFEKDMKGAVDIADRRTKEIEGRFSQMNSAVSGKLQQLSRSISGPFGVVGQILSTLGPLGVTAAVGLGTAVGAMLALANATGEFATRAKALREGAETAGLTITQFKLLGEAGQRVGLNFDETAAFFTKFIANMEALRQGGGPLYDALLKIDAALLRELSTTTDSARAIDILTAAMARLTDQTKRLDLARAAGGRGGLTGAQLLENLGKTGGLTGLEAASPNIDEAQITRAARLKDEIEAIRRKTANIWGGMFSDLILQNQKGIAEELKAIAEFVERIVGAKERSAAIAPEPAATFLERFGGQPKTKVTVNPAAPPQGGGGGSPSVELAILQKNLALLGDAVTQGEQWRLKRLEIAAAAEKGGLSDGIAGRALAAFNVTMRAAALATRERLGIATEQQIVETKLIQLQQDRTKFGLSENEVQLATVVILREAKEAADALTVRQAYLPGLKQLELDAQNTRKVLDQFGVSSLNTMSDGLADLVTGTKKASDAFRDMANAILHDLARIAIRQAITAPLAGLFGGLFPARAGGGPVSAGMPYVVGERGPELFVPKQAGAIVPGSVTARGGGGTTIVINNNPSFSTDMSPSARAQILSDMQQNNNMLRGQIIQDIRVGQSNDSSFIGRG